MIATFIVESSSPIYGGKSICFPLFPGLLAVPEGIIADILSSTLKGKQVLAKAEITYPTEGQIDIVLTATENIPFLPTIGGSIEKHESLPGALVDVIKAVVPSGTEIDGTIKF
jgi:hypothetical protein